MDYTLDLTDSLIIQVEAYWDIGEDLTLELEDEMSIDIESFIRGGNNIRLSFEEVVAIAVSLDSTTKIKRVGDTAFIRTNYP